MNMIKKLSEMAVDETFGALKYAKMAVRKKTEHPEIAATLYKMSDEELTHAATLHSMATAELEKCKKDNPVEAVTAGTLYDYLYEMQAEKTAEVKSYQAMYKGA